jgi:hypothetical protein
LAHAIALLALAAVACRAIANVGEHSISLACKMSGSGTAMTDLTSA